MPKTIPIKDIPPTFDPNRVFGVFNPLKEDFHFKFGGKPFILKAESHQLWPEPLTNHAAKHLAKKICREEIKEFLIEQFPGLDDGGREKWRMNQTHFVTMKDVDEVKKSLLFNHEEDPNPEIKKPKSRIGKLKDQLDGKPETKEPAKEEAEEESVDEGDQGPVPEKKSKSKAKK